MTITLEEMKRAAAQALSYRPQGASIRVALGPDLEFRDWYPGMDGPLPNLNIRTVTFIVRELKIDGARVNALYYNDVIMGMYPS